MIRRGRPALWLAAVLASGLVITGAASPASAAPRNNHDRGFIQTNLVSDIPGLALHTDANLINPWGISTSPGAPLWLSDNGTGLSTLYDGTGAAAPAASPLIVTIPSASGPSTTGTPTGTVSNTPNMGFTVTQASHSGPSRFLFATEDGTLSGWSPSVDPTHAIIAVNRSAATDPEGDVGAVYKGLALATTSAGEFLYATNFRFGQVEIFDSTFALVRTFTDPRIPSGYGPFGIQNINGDLYVTYAKQDAEKHDDAAGAGNGFVDVFNTSGDLLRRFVSRGPLNSPWAVTQVPTSVRSIGGDILIGNFGDGRINAFSAKTGRFIETLRTPRGTPIAISGLWDLKYPTGSLNVPANTLYFTAGLNGEDDGLFGTLTAAR